MNGLTIMSGKKSKSTFRQKWKHKNPKSMWHSESSPIPSPCSITLIWFPWIDDVSDVKLIRTDIYPWS